MHERNTKYIAAVREFVGMKGHASNADILAHLQRAYPAISATTIHRITSRLVERGEFIYAPATKDNAFRFDTTTSPHAHFQCIQCDCLRDISLPHNFIETLQEQLGDCKLTGPLTLQGTCMNCQNEREK
ncbi:MAG TPA: transcriptional repressor [Candidatus Saccharimonadales bacterium]